jgi:hypothetical protein
LSEQTPLNKTFDFPTSSVPNTIRVDTTAPLPDGQRQYVEQIKNVVREYVEVNDNLEFNEYSKTYRVNLKQYYQVDFDNPVKAYTSIA